MSVDLLLSSGTVSIRRCSTSLVSSKISLKVMQNNFKGNRMTSSRPNCPQQSHKMTTKKDKTNADTKTDDQKMRNYFKEM